MRRNLIRLVKALVAVALLVGLYWAADWRAVLRSARDLDAVWLGAAMLMFVPQTLVSALRWRTGLAPCPSRLVAAACGPGRVSTLDRWPRRRLDLLELVTQLRGPAA